MFPGAAQSTPGLAGLWPGLIPNLILGVFFSPGFQCVMGSNRAARIYNVNKITMPLFKQVNFFLFV